MRIETDEVIPFPREQVFASYRDAMPEFVEFLPNVRAIEVESRKEEGAVVRLVNVWRGGGEFPVGVRELLTDSVLSWHDYATWDPAEWACEWHIETHAFAEAVACRGQSKFVELDGGRTRVEMTGEIEIDLKRGKGPVRLMPAAVGRKVEQFLVRQITTNLAAISDALTKYLERQSESS